MASGFRKKRGGGEYVFVNGRAVRVDEAATLAPGQAEAGREAPDGNRGIPDRREPVSDSQVEPQVEPQIEPQIESAPESGAVSEAVSRAGFEPASETRSASETASEPVAARSSAPDASASRSASPSPLAFEQAESLMHEDRRILRAKYLGFGGLLAVLAIFSLCINSTSIGTFHSPLDVVRSIGGWFELTFTQIVHPDLYTSTYRQINQDMPYYADCMLQIWIVFKYLACGMLLALSGMLYQNTFRNPIAAPSMLGVSNGINFALLILVLQFGSAAIQQVSLYYIYSIIGGVAILAIVMLGGKWISGAGRFNVVNMILMGTIVSQLLGVVITYVQAMYLDDAAWEVFYMLQSAAGAIGPWAYGTLIIGGIVAIVPIIMYRFKLNLISFTDDETRLLGVNPNKLRLVALGCGTLMILVGQLNAGQIAMASLIVPFIVRAVFGSEFRKQLAGNLIMGALIMLACGDIGTFILFDGMPIGVAPVVSVVAIPLFVWMLAIRQRSWE